MYFFQFTNIWVFLFATAVSASYVLSPEDTYQGHTFFEKFDFFTAADPNVGFVQYLDQNTATNARLVSVNDAQQVYIGVDYENTYDVNGSRGRPSIRLETKKNYQYGLFVFDLAHMPANTCGKWSAFWTTNKQDWPRWGEIDIIENIHENNNTLEALHTSPGCSVAGNQISTQMTGRQTTYNCDGKATSSQYGAQGSGQGCVAENMSPNNYGKAFNDVGGGVYAMEWNNQAINIWNFHRDNIPKDLASGNPNPEGWGPAVFTTKQGSCPIDDHFKDQIVVIDSAFCGNWAGQDAFWQQTSCYKSDPAKYPTCSSYVAANPAAYKESYWLVNSLKVYQKISSNASSTSAPMSPVPMAPAPMAPAPMAPAPMAPAPMAPAPMSPAPMSPVPMSPALMSPTLMSPTLMSPEPHNSPSDSPNSHPKLDNSISQVVTEVPLTSTEYVAPVGTASVSGMPYFNINGSVPNYRPTATGSLYTTVASIATQTPVSVDIELSDDDESSSPKPKFETAGSSKSVKARGSSAVALIAALALGMAI
ncbi:Endo-1,3-beta-glucanase [Erysiphe neolycopersici]|uniref:Endo-1,3-beta-glucanase n=1 Tax=Erysiphe neolycopersici TaxID=212602 RepID=A0A420HFI3_9PEZI|nr:Endo-1,3-beta-glucanase [Erysiphe neolycopersici]